MLSVEQALKQVLTNAQPREPRAVNAADAAGLVLAEDITSDVDSPPHDKSLVDGYAVVAASLTGGVGELAILEEVTAGAVPTHKVTSGSATRIMTGAPLPEGADAVVMIEQTTLKPSANSHGRVAIQTTQVTPGQNIMRRAASMSRGDLVLRAGSRLRAIELGLLAEVGRTQVQAIPRPSMAVLSTGDELVTAAEVPAAGHIRNSNGPMLLALAAEAGAMAVDLGIARDEREAIADKIRQGLESDVLVISGGVSAGVLDLVPGVLAECGVREVFHKVQLKPGKPLWFGVSDGPSGTRLVFGLPGNPVSSLVCFELFVRPALARLAGRDAAWKRTTARLTIDFSQRGDRPTYHPSCTVEAAGGVELEPLRWRGSADLRTLADANSLACFPAGTREFKAGEIVEAIWLSR